LNLIKEPKTDFGNWTINLDLFCLQNNVGNEIFVQPRLLRLLSALFNNANRVVSKEDLNKLIWDEVIVGEESLSKAVFDLRKFLEANFSNPPSITTIRKVGYKLQLNLANKNDTAFNRATKILKIIAYIVGGVIILTLVLRGLQYEN
jgi:DNA-binding winged helix-turn-helix (wHTH) protein